MVVREISLYLLLGNLIAAVGSTCVPVQCLRYNNTGDNCTQYPVSAAPCITVTSDILSHCQKDFQVSINSTGSEVSEGDDVTLTCVHNIPPLDLNFWWEMNKKEVQGSQNKSQLVLRNVLPHDEGQYVCFVNSTCGGPYKSSPHDVTVNDNTVLLLVICGVSALVLIMALGLVMKFKLKRDNAKHRERMKQRAQAVQNGGPTALTPRES